MSGNLECDLPVLLCCGHGLPSCRCVPIIVYQSMLVKPLAWQTLDLSQCYSSLPWSSCPMSSRLRHQQKQGRLSRPKSNNGSWSLAVAPGVRCAKEDNTPRTYAADWRPKRQLKDKKFIRSVDSRHRWPRPCRQAHRRGPGQSSDDCSSCLSRTRRNLPVSHRPGRVN